MSLLFWTGLIGVPAEPLALEDPGASFLLLLALAAVGLEMTARPLPAIGFLSAAFSCYLAAALDFGPGRAALLVMVSLSLRTVFRGHPTAAGRLREWTADFFPAVSALGAVYLATALAPAGAPPAWLVPVVATVAYVQLALLVPSRTTPQAEEWNRDGNRFKVPVASALCGVVLGVLGRFQPWSALWLLPVLFLLPGRRESADEDEVKLTLKEMALERADRTLSAEREAGERLRTDLYRKVDENILLTDMIAELSRGPDLGHTLDVLVRVCKSMVACDSVAVFLATRRNTLRWAHGVSHLAKRIESIEREHLEEPVVLEAWSTGFTQYLPPGRENLPSRVFLGERSALAVPIHGFGALYVGRRAGRAFDPEHVHLLTIAAGVGATAIRSAQRHEAQRSALALEARARTQLESAFRSLEELLHCAHQLSRTLETRKLLDELEQCLETLIPHDSHLVVLRWETGDRIVRGRLQLDPAPAGHPVADALMEQPRPLLVENVAGSIFPPLSPGETALLAAPCLVEGRPIGVLMLGRAGESFGRQHQDLLCLLAHQAGAALENARLHADTVEAHRKLQESEAQLIQSTKMAAVGQLASGVAHELNTPLGGLLLSLDSALRNLTRQPDRVAPMLEMGIQAIQSAQSIVDKLLYYSRDVLVGERETDLNELIRDTLDLVGHRLRLDGVDVELDLGQIPPVLCNKNEIQQVVNHLIFNARDALKAAPEAGPIVIRSCREGDRVAVAVSDPGPGIPPEILPRIFDPFYTTKPVGQGAGLGLSVGRQIATQHGGSLTVRSEPGQGATFTLALPVPKEEP